jgi:hypothetical protein
MLYMEVITLYSWEEQCETYKQTVLVKCSFIKLRQLMRISMGFKCWRCWNQGVCDEWTHSVGAFQQEYHLESCWGSLFEISQMEDFEGGLRILLLQIWGMRLWGCGVDWTISASNRLFYLWCWPSVFCHHEVSECASLNMFKCSCM